MVDAAISSALVPVSTVALPEDPVVFKEAPAAKVLPVSSRVIVASLALVVKVASPVIARVPLSVMLPVTAVAA